MNDAGDFSYARQSARRMNRRYQGRPHPNGALWSQASPTLTAWTILELILHHTALLVCVALLTGAAFGFLAQKLIRPKYTASSLLLRYETPGTSEFFKTTAPLSQETFSGMIRSPELLLRVGQQVDPPIPPERLGKSLKVDSVVDSDLIKVSLAATNSTQAVTLLNLYTKETVEFMRQLQANQASLVANSYLRKQLEEMDQDITVLHREFRNLPVAPQVSSKLAEVGGQVSRLSENLASNPRPNALLTLQTEHLSKALGELTELTSRYTDIHPLVQQKRSEVAALQSQISRESTNPSLPALTGAALLSSRSGDAAFNPELDIIRTKLLSLEEGRVQLATRQHEAELYANNPPGMVRVWAPATLKTVQYNWHWFKIGIVSGFGALLGLGAAVCLAMLVEFADKRLKTESDVRRVTHLPILASLGDVHRMSDEARGHWAFRTWTMLQGHLSRSPNYGLVCGITSSTHGEGRSTWISLLAEAASLTGFRVLTIATSPEPTAEDGASAALNGYHQTPPLQNANSTNAVTAASVLSFPAQVTEQFNDPNSQPVVHIPLPGWVWNLERRKEWQQALSQWREVENLVILVELPPASVTEAVLLGSSLPNLVWLVNGHTARADSTREQLQTLRDARCNLVGAVVNQPLIRSFALRFPRWLCCVLCLLALSAFQCQLPAQLPPPALGTPTPNTNSESPLPHTFSIVQPSQRAHWQEHLTLGPGDVLDFGLYGEPELLRKDVAIGPDGRVSYLEAQDVQATGLTIDELRAKLDQELARYRRAPRTLLTPVAFRSKKYYMLGKVMAKGVYTLDRPLTVLEALARARGVENGLVDRNVVDLADFSRSFVARKGQRIPLDFEKLFQQGDLSQNIAVEPEDYIYIAGADVQEVYLVGEVRMPGPTSYTPQMSIVQAITARGGFTERAFRARVLVVRGSLNCPQAIAVDTHAILDGKEPDFKLRPKDIVYVNSRPFVRVEELTDLAATAFLQSLISSWVDVRVLKPFN